MDFLIDAFCYTINGMIFSLFVQNSTPCICDELMWLVESSVVISEGKQMNVCRDNNVTLLYEERERERDNYNIRERHILQQRERES